MIDYVKLIDRVTKTVDVASAVKQVIDDILDRVEGSIGIKAAAQGVIDEARAARDVLAEAVAATPGDEEGADKPEPKNSPAKKL